MAFYVDLIAGHLLLFHPSHSELSPDFDLDRKSCLTINICSPKTESSYSRYRPPIAMLKFIDVVECDEDNVLVGQ